MKFPRSKDITPENLMGTKWIAVDAAADDINTIEFVDKAYCIFTFPNKVKLQTYKIHGGQIFINNSISYAIKDNTFFHNDTPLYIKE